VTRRVEKPWGHEEIWAETDRYVGKVLFIKAGERLSLQHHTKKDETVRLLRGEMLLELENDLGKIELVPMLPGMSAYIPPGRKHRMAAKTDVELLEVSTPELDDVIRHEDDYGRAG